MMRGGPLVRAFDVEAPKRPISPRTLPRIARFFRPYWRQVAVVVLAILVSAALGLVNPYLLKLIIDEAIPRGDLGLLNLYVALMILVPIVAGLISIGQTYLNNLVGLRVMQDLRNTLYAHLQRLPLRFFTATRTGEIQSRLANDVGGVQTVVTDTATSVVSNLTVAVSTIVAMLLIDWRLTLIALGLLPFFMYFTYRVGSIRREISGSAARTLADLSALVEETLSVSGVLLTKTFGRQEQAVERFRRENQRLAGLQLRQQMVGRWFFMVIQTFFAITPAIVYLVAGHLMAGGDRSITIGSIVAFTTLQSRLFFPLGQLLNVQVEIQSALALFDRIFEYLDLPLEITDRPGARELRPEQVRGRVSFDHVWFRYPRRPLDSTAGAEAGEDVAAEENGRSPGSPASVATAPAATDGAGGNGEDEGWTLRDVSFEAEPGQLVALVGPSGAGKTTITYLIPRLYDVDRGAVRIDGIDVRDVTLASLGQVVGVVTQETYLFHASVRENLLYGRPDATDAELEAAAKAAAIHDVLMALPEGYDTLVGERGYRLSGGEKQRLALARVILKNPRILILDEATSALDTRSERLVQQALERLMHGRTTIAIAHRLSTILAADQILVVEGGRIVERGTHAELLAQGGLYARLYRQQFARGEESAPSPSAPLPPSPPAPLPQGERGG